LINPSDTNILWRFPALIAKVPEILNNAVEFIMFEWFPIETYNVEIDDVEETALMLEITRSISRSVLFCIEFIPTKSWLAVKKLLSHSPAGTGSAKINGLTGPHCPGPLLPELR